MSGLLSGSSLGLSREPVPHLPHTVMSLRNPNRATVSHFRIRPHLLRGSQTIDFRKVDIGPVASKQCLQMTTLAIQVEQGLPVNILTHRLCSRLKPLTIYM